MDKDRRLTMSIRAILNKIFGLRAIFCLRYFRQRRRFPDLDNPKDYSEILISRILSDEYLKFADLTDKVKVRDYVRAKGLDDILLEHYGHYDTFDQIDRELLPEKFVLKTNRGASAKDVCICTDKSTFDWDAARKKLEKGMKHQYEYEAHYNIIKPRIICEELIDEGDGKMPVDYKFTCIEGKPASILVCTERGIGEPRQCTFDTNWKPLPYIKSKYLPKQLPQRPDQLERMTEIAGILSEDFEHVRVDLYEYKGRVFFSELTFTPGCGILYSYNRQAIDTIGEMFGGELNMAETKISVIIPTYRPGDYIKECLASLVEQTFPHNRFEVIVVLNGDKEPYFTLLQTYIIERCRGLDIKLLHTGTKGVSNARNMAIDIARGEFISFIDDDDYVSGTYLEELYFKAAESTIVICCPKAFKDGDPTPLSYRPAELFRRLAPDGRQDFLRARSLLHITCMKLIPREMIGSRRYDTSFSIGEDTLMMFTISDKLKYVDFTSEHAIYYRRIRNSSAVSAFQRERISCRIKNSLRLSFKYASIYSGNPFEYSFVFMLTRIWGAIHSIVKL